MIARGLTEATHVDVAVIGAGLAGTSAAILLARTGRRVVLIDTHATHPPEFRAEKMGEYHLAMFCRLGLGDVVDKHVTPIDGGWIYRFGRLVQHATWREYGFAYADLINGLRGALPPAARFVVGRVASVDQSPDLQRIVMSDGSAITARLIVLATGLGDTVRRKLGIRRVEAAKAHSLSLGFTLAQPAASFPFGSLTYYARNVASRFAYLTLFPIGTAMRANFFVYREPGEAWTQVFRRDPQAAMRSLLPELADCCGDFAVSGPVEVRAIDLIAAEDYRRDGVVLLGDAFRTTCPIPGVGIQRVMTDVEQLCTVHAPAWFTTPGMGRDKIGSFYDDPIKQAMDRAAVAAGMRARAIATDRSLRWSARRLCNNLARRGIYRAHALSQGVSRALRTAP